MTRSRASLPLAGVLVLVGATQSVGGSLCRPVLTVTAVGFSEISPAQREWTAKFAVDASRCAATSGRFAIDFVRLKENAPDLRFSEPFTWTSSKAEASVHFSADEAVLDYAIGDVAPCACRE